MSNVTVSDRRGGMFRTIVEFSYGECERLPFNLLRRAGAKIGIVPDGGITATADFNIRRPGESSRFLELLELFGEGGSFAHGSAADPSAVALASPPSDDLIMVRDDDLEVEETLSDDNNR